MILKMFSVLDSKVGVFSTPFFDQNESSATRNFSDSVKDGSNPNNLWHKHPEDFSLYAVGEFDTDTAELLPSHPKSIITASALMSLDSSAQMDMFDKNLAVTK